MTNSEAVGISASRRLLAVVADSSAAVASFSCLIIALELPPFTRAWVPAAMAMFGVALWLGQKAVFGVSLGERFAGLKAPNLLPASPLSRLRVQLLRKPASATGTASILTAAALGLAGACFQQAVISHPLWLASSFTKMEPYFPPTSVGSEQESWTIAPFFYAMGAWPTRFRGQPVFYTLPYEKGPPGHFIGHIIARWEAPFTRVTFEGPKTPEVRNRTILRDCIASRSLGCAAVREEALERHVREMSTTLRRPGQWQLRWFKVENSALPAGEEAQGFALSASSATRGQDRYVFITPAGTHQAVVFDYPKSAAGEGAREVFRQAIRTTRVSDDLAQGRSWVNKQLQTTSLDEISRGGAGPAALQRLADVQTLLLSKASVDPKTFDTYFHIGGTSLMVARFGKALGSLDGNIAATPTLMTLESVHRYARDVSPDDPRVARLQEFIMDAKKYF